MKTIVILNAALIVIGATLLGYDHYSYAAQESILQIGIITAAAERAHSESLLSTIGWLLIGGGACVVAFAALSKKD